ncbi:MAG: 2-oxo acid dehydrogenase subunit E2 [Anaerolineaceae bacterium]
MATEILLVKAGMTMTEGAVAEWHVLDGGEVRGGGLLYRMETEKIELEVEAEASGIVRHAVRAGIKVAPGQLIGFILAPGEPLPSGFVPPPPSTASGTRDAVGPSLKMASSGAVLPSSPLARRLAKEAGIDLGLISGSGPSGRITEADVLRFQSAPPQASKAIRASAQPREILASPLARKLAERLQVDLSGVRGTGPGGRITQEDVEAANVRPTQIEDISAEAKRLAPSPQRAGDRIPVRGMRKVIGERMRASLQDMAQLTMAMDVAMDECVKLRAQLIDEWAAEGVRPSYTDFVLKAVSKALRRHPLLNSTMHETEIELLNDVNLGMAVAVIDGLLVPVIRNADRLTLKAIAVESSRLAEAARTGSLSLDEMAEGTFSVTALGMVGIDFFTPVVNPPNVAILGVGRIRDAVAWEGERPMKRQVMTLSLTIDHRVVDGVPGAAFLGTVRERLEAPYRLLV